MKKQYEIISHSQLGIDPGTGIMGYEVRYYTWEGCRCSRVEKMVTIHTNGVPSVKLLAQADLQA